MTLTGLSGLERSSARGSTSVEDEDDEVREVVPPDQNESHEMKKALDKLRSLCGVLGISYSAKISEFGTVVERSRLNDAMDFLITTRDHNFDELRKISKEMIAEWRLSRPPFKRMSQFSWILYIRDADSADELSGKDLLSTDSVHKARKEVIALKKERDEMVERRYTAKRQKLRNLLKYSHLVNNDVHFSPREPVEKMQLKSEIQNIKQAINKAKSLASERTHLVLRVELVRKAKSLEDLEVLISNAKSAARVLQMGDEAVPYDGKCVDSVLSTYRERFISAAIKKDTKKARSKVVPTNKAKNLPHGRTRKGTLYLREEATDEETSEESREEAADEETAEESREEAAAEETREEPADESARAEPAGENARD
ncbi:hypothetical protein SETIT_7G282200v2 [Setaria italica]|nr:uncharacterized protein LOC101771166 [Setaria italica]XP_004987393.1 uncharacterized protein LOC101758131 [Setaria italica]RCU61711.1 hypothetical protein SETIT_J027500v2 [Setaria italica]RCU61712.1 hypothetical protein SETIT_J027500v2 [Setaria italica]RCV35972.1 hypothetical protein SETIT_7G282200v2 [Setaria italica]RCV35973.1 hypothetical protein SETIT_7G282200v2 [Setaria italica]RCV35974.1 hypothetical protein SETIT_7G282200v2 [Setaria italica]